MGRWPASQTISANSTGVTGGPIAPSRSRSRSMVITVGFRAEVGHHVVGQGEDVIGRIVELGVVTQVDRVEQLIVGEQPTVSALEEMGDDLVRLLGELARAA